MNRSHAPALACALEVQGDPTRCIRQIALKRVVNRGKGGIHAALQPMNTVVDGGLQVTALDVTREKLRERYGIRLFRIHHKPHALVLSELCELVQAAVHGNFVMICGRGKFGRHVQIFHLLELFGSEDWKLLVFGQKLCQQKQHATAAKQVVNLRAECRKMCRDANLIEGPVDHLSEDVGSSVSSHSR